MDTGRRLRREAEGYYNPWSADAKRRRREQDRWREANDVAESFHKGGSGLEWEHLSDTQQECLRKRYPVQYAAKPYKTAARSADAVSRPASPASTQRRVFKATKSRLATSALVDDEASNKEDASEALYPPGRDILSALEDYLDAYEAKEATNVEQSLAPTSANESPQIPAKRSQEDQAAGENASKRLCVSDGGTDQVEGISRWKLRVNERSKIHRKGQPQLPELKMVPGGINHMPVTEEALGSHRLSGHAVMESEKEHLPWWMHNDMLEIVD